MAAVQSFRCEKCQKLQCSLCDDWKATADFPKEQLKHSSEPGRRLRCVGCCHLQCVAPSCNSCTICRSPACRKKKGCKGPIAALHPKQMPKVLAEVNSFLCDSCRFTTCVTEHADRVICGKVAPKQSQRDLQAKKNAYTCGDCLTAENSKKSLAAAVAQT